MSLWTELPESFRDGGALDALRPVLDSIDAPSSTERAEEDGRWRVWETSLGGGEPLAVDPANGRFVRGSPPSNIGAILIEFPDPAVGIEFALRLDGPGGSPDGTVRLLVRTPSAAVRLPFLRGAKLDPQGQLRADPEHPIVRFRLPALRIRVLRPAGGGFDLSLLSASLGDPVDQIYEFVRMDPPYALIGPGEVVGFAFRTAVLDLSGSAGPSGVPPEARAMPGLWQGFYLPEVRLFVAPSGLEGLAVSAGVRELWIGIGRHAGVTGLFEADAVERGSAPRIRLRFQTAAGEWIGVPDTDSATPVSLPASAHLHVDAGGGLAPFGYEVQVGGVTTTTDHAEVAVPESGTLSIQVQVTDAGGHRSSRTLLVQRRPAPLPGEGITPPGAPVRAHALTSTGSRIVLESEVAGGVRVRLEPPDGEIVWSWSGGSASGETAEVPVSASAPITLTASRTRAAASVLPIDAFMLFDRPRASDGDAWADNPANTHAAPASARDGWGASPVLVDDAFAARLAALPSGTSWTVEGWASYEGDDSAGKRSFNEALSARRRDALVRILERHGFAGRVTPGAAHGHAAARDGIDPEGGTAPAPGAPAWWRARASATLPAATTEIVRAELVRPAPEAPAPEIDPEQTRAPVPECFRKIGVRVELMRGTFVRAELYGEFDLRTAAEQRLAASTPGSMLPARTNPLDGICTFLIRLRIAEDRSGWDVKAEFRALEGDLDGLARVERRATGDSKAIDVLGAVAALSPLLAAATPPNPTAGELVPLVVLSGAAVAVGASGVLQTRSVILRGGELVVTDGLIDPADGTGPRTTSVSVLLDIETAFTFDLGFIRVDPAKPIVARYRAVGVRSTWASRPREDGTIEYLPLPVFDPSRGYALEVPAGSLIVGSPLGELLRILGMRISRDNPTFLEVEVGMGVDLGIVQVDTVRIRLRLDRPELPQLTALGASIEVPGTLHGSGRVEITPAGFKGAFDLTIELLNLRASATLAIESVDGVTGILIGAEVEFPVPLPLGNSGLGLYGFLGGVGVNYARREPANVQAPALKWLESQLAPPRKGVMDPAGWEHRAGSWAFAAGILLGTAEGGFILHLKGIALLELPGPRLMLVMKADVLTPPPVLRSGASATFLAMLDLDFGRGTITIGLVAEYSIVSLLRIRVPVTAFFDTHQVEHWSVNLGTLHEPVSITVLDIFSGVGYLMISGNGIDHPVLKIQTRGLTVAVGFHLQCVLMGSKAARLYLEVAAGFDALVSLEPLAIVGKIRAQGELRLFIVGIGASAELQVDVRRERHLNGTETEITYVRGEVCGEVDLFFFTVRGCVSLQIGAQPPPGSIPRLLVRGVSLVSRSPALLEGSAIDRAVDGVIADALASGEAGDLPSVPLDAIPVVLFDAPAQVAPGGVILGGSALNASALPANPWVRRGDRWWRYRIAGIDLVGALRPAPPEGKVPATWWTRGLPGESEEAPALALLSWLPTPFSRAVPYGEQLKTMVSRRWGRICGPVARPAPVLWSFDRQPLGPSEAGWKLASVPWPDAPGSYRSSPIEALLQVRERWRTGDGFADRLQGTDPARIVGDAVPCPNGRIREVDSLKPWMAGQPLTFSRLALPPDETGLDFAAARLAEGISLHDLPAYSAGQGWDPELARIALSCEGRILRSPTDDEPEPAPDGTDLERGRVKKAWEATRFRPSELQDSILLRTEAGVIRLELLLLLPVRRFEGHLLLRFRDRSGQTLGDRQVTPGDLVGPGHPLPARWLDPAGPWADPVERAGRIAARVAATDPGLGLALVGTDLPKTTVEIEIGWERARMGEVSPPAFWIVAMEGLIADEAARFEWDRTILDTERTALETALSQDPDEHALLVPGESYQVRVRWQGQSLEQDERPAASVPEAWGPEEVQEYRFRTDPVSAAPTTLAPWLLASAPAMGEAGIFCREPIRLALSTQKVTALFDAYEKELRVRIRAASGRHPEPPGGGAPGSDLILPLGLGGFVKPAPSTLQVMTPWQQAATELLDTMECMDGGGSTVHHSIVELPYDLEPLTDYLLDVLAVPRGAAQNATGDRIHRVNFTTSRFGTIEELASLVRLAAVEHRLVSHPAALAGVGRRPRGDQLDLAFQNAGLDLPEVPRYPRVQLLWSADPIPQPVAVVVECAEAMWRERPMPQQVAGPIDAADPDHRWWKAVPSSWLLLEEHGGPSAPGDPPRAPVKHIVRGPGDTRALVLLDPGARGSELRLDFVLAADELAAIPARRAEALRLRLLRAPWEEEE